MQGRRVVRRPGPIIGHGRPLRGPIGCADGGLGASGRGVGHRGRARRLRGRAAAPRAARLPRSGLAWRARARFNRRLRHQRHGRAERHRSRAWRRCRRVGRGWHRRRLLRGFGGDGGAWGAWAGLGASCVAWAGLGAASAWGAHPRSRRRPAGRGGIPAKRAGRGSARDRRCPPPCPAPDRPSGSGRHAGGGGRASRVGEGAFPSPLR